MKREEENRRNEAKNNESEEIKKIEMKKWREEEEMKIISIRKSKSARNIERMKKISKWKQEKKCAINISEENEEELISREMINEVSWK